jgi:histidyl-tRNA synthetase
MEEYQQIIKELQNLKKIKPDKEWVIKTKAEILKEEKTSWFFVLKPALIAGFSLLLLFGVNIFAQNSLPGTPLYPLKKVAEDSQKLFIPEEKLPLYQIELTEKRLEELEKVVKENDTRKISPALSEFNSVKKETEKKIQEIVQKNPQKAEEIAPQLLKIEKKENEVLTALGLNDTKKESLKNLAESLIKSLENSSLSDSQLEILKSAKDAFEKGDYSTALEMAIKASQTR